MDGRAGRNWKPMFGRYWKRWEKLVIMGKIDKVGRSSIIYQKIPYEGNFGGNLGRRRPT